MIAVRPGGQQQGHIRECIEPIHHRNPGIGKDGAGHGKVARHGAGVGLGRAARRLRAARLHQDEALALFLCAGRQSQQRLRLAHLLHEQRHHAGCLVLQDGREEVLGPERRLVAGADQKRDPETRGDERIADGIGDGPTLGDHGNPGHPGCSTRRRHRLVLAEGEGDAIDVVDEAEAVRPAHQNAALPGQRRQPHLQRPTLRPGLSEAGGEHDGRVDPAAPAGGDGLQHRLTRQIEDDGIEPLRQVIDRGHARVPGNLRPGTADEMQAAREAGTLEVGEHIAADGARVVGSADDGYRARPQEARNGGGRGRIHRVVGRVHRRGQRRGV